jgi:hypothetical protein
VERERRQAHREARALPTRSCRKSASPRAPNVQAGSGDFGQTRGYTWQAETSIGDYKTYLSGHVSWAERGWTKSLRTSTLVGDFAQTGGDDDTQ